MKCSICKARIRHPKYKINGNFTHKPCWLRYIFGVKITIDVSDFFKKIDIAAKANQ